MDDHVDPTLDYKPESPLRELELKFVEQWRSGERPLIEDFVSCASPGAKDQVVERLVVIETRFRRELGEEIDPAEYLSRLSSFREPISRALKLAYETEVPTSPTGVETRSFADLDVERTEEYYRPTESQTQTHLKALSNSRSDGSTKRELKFGRYRVERELGQGGFGIVYLAIDDELQRRVAIKVASSGIDKRNEELYLSEARAVATLDHPHIVTVYDVGHTASGELYVVSRLIEGKDLRTRLESVQPNIQQSISWLLTLADALHHAHCRGLVHRDVKPANILIDEEEQAYLCDFGLALREEHFGKGPVIAGTPAYMSPEQARGEGHRVDARSDIYSLGVVMYELFTGMRPFSGNTPNLLHNIVHIAPRPLRQIHETLPEELERIALKCLAKRTSERYNTAADLADDLRAYLQEGSQLERRGVKVVPKGLRSFDAQDSDFYISLLPGVRDRFGLPSNIAFWKHHLEERDSAQTFGVGLIYGPSGCGKSSLVKAGILPRLANSVRPIYVEASVDHTETRLLSSLSNACPEVAQQSSLKDAVSTLRLADNGHMPRKVVLVIDQFEQWLYSRSEYSTTELANALRQCDGGNVQTILLIRDDFWMAANRFFRELDIKLVEGHNTGAIDLFDCGHARKVLAEFGKAFGQLLEDLNDMSSDQQRFLDEVINGLSTDGRVIAVQLALLAEMVKSKPWGSATLQKLGGISGVGVVFLEEAFGTVTSLPARRRHENAVRSVLRELLPNELTDIKGCWKSEESLRKASGYESQVDEFDDLMGILSKELRLIAPIDPESLGAGTPHNNLEKAGVVATPKHYQLTHDYLVPSLREWLTRKQKETPKGRAEIALADRAAVWKARPENRQLPSAIQWLWIYWYTNSSQWTSKQREMMSKAGRVIGTQALVVATLILSVGIAISQVQRETTQRTTQTVVDSLQGASSSAVPFILEKLESVPRKMALAELERRVPNSDGQARLKIAYGLAHLEILDIDAIIAGIIDPETPSDDVINIAVALRPVTAEAIRKLKLVAAQASKELDWTTKIRIATIAMYLGDTSIAQQMLRDQSELNAVAERADTQNVEFDPIERTRFIAAFPNWCGEISELANQLADTESGQLRSGIALALGRMENPSASVKVAWRSVLSDWYASAPDGGTHSAAQWALRQWNLELPAVAPTAKPVADRFWWQTSELTLIRIPAGTVNTDAGLTTVNRDFWLSDREVDVELFQQFINDAEYSGPKPHDWAGATVFENDDLDNLPVQQVSWFDAVMFCNWMSWKLDLDPAYEIVETDKGNQDAAYLVTLLPNRGVRLPLESEWEYACRAMTTTEFSFGDDPNDLGDYGDFALGDAGIDDSPRYVVTGSKQCNAWGLFDMHGSVWEWCWDRVEDQDQDQGHFRACRGGSWFYTAINCRSSTRNWYEPFFREMDLGFRVAIDL